MSICATNAFQVDLDTDNSVDIRVENADGESETSLSTVTRATFDIGDTTVDSDVDGSSVIWWTDTVEWRGTTIAVVSLRLGQVAGLAAGTYEGCRLTLYTTTLTNGWRYQSEFKVTVKA